MFLLQETWLSDCTSSVLDNFHKDFAAFHTSAMEDKISRNIMLGCLFVYGGDFNVTESVRNECSKLLNDFCSLNGLCWLLYENDDSCYT